MPGPHPQQPELTAGGVDDGLQQTRADPVAAVHLEDIQPADAADGRTRHIRIDVEAARPDNAPSTRAANSSSPSWSKRPVSAAHSSTRRRTNRKPSRSLSATS